MDFLDIHYETCFYTGYKRDLVLSSKELSLLRRRVVISRFRGDLLSTPIYVVKIYRRSKERGFLSDLHIMSYGVKQYGNFNIQRKKVTGHRNDMTKTIKEIE